MAKPTLYVSDTCGYCHLVLNALSPADLARVELVNTSHSRANEDRLKATGARGTPALVAGGRVYLGPRDVLAALGKRGGAR